MEVDYKIPESETDFLGDFLYENLVMKDYSFKKSHTLLYTKSCWTKPDNLFPAAFLTTWINLFMFSLSFVEGFKSAAGGEGVKIR